MQTFMLLTLSLLIPFLGTPSTRPTEFTTTTAPRYVIQAGDTLWAIAQQHHVSVDDLRAANPGIDPYALSVGQLILLPNGQNDKAAPTPEAALYHTIRAGDTLSGVAVQYHFTTKEILAANPGINPYALRVGQQIRLPDDDTPGTETDEEASAVANNAETYTVQAGDTLSGIAVKTEIPLKTLIALNPSINPRLIVAGQLIRLSEPPPVPAVMEPTTVSVNPNLIQPLNANADRNDAVVIPELAGSVATEQAISPLETSFAALNLPQVDTPTTDDEPTPAASAPKLDAAQPAVQPELSPLAGNVMPITITIKDLPTVKNAELAINDRVLKTFGAEVPISYDLDTNLLTEGTYRLSLTVTRENGVVSTGSLEFQVEVLTPEPAVEATPTAPQPVKPKSARDLVISYFPSSLPAIEPAAAADLPARRILRINGQIVPFSFTFSSTEGLAIVAPNPNNPIPATLGEILSRPINAIPAPIRESLVAQRPELWSAVTLILTIVLLPQGLFTLYWMLYTWNNPEIADRYRAPKTYVQPQFSFTAILPARREEGVIKDTIKAVNRIDYPDDLKEILIMIRDEDDDLTIQRANEAIAELGKDNIKLITFTEGPKNKPNGLNRGLKAATKDVICVFDAEDEPHPELYNVINTVMVRDDADVVQAGVQLMNFKSSWFSALNCLEYFFWFKSGLHCFTRKLNVTPLGGNTVFFKRYWLERINGWDENSLTEDADVGIRLTLQGAKIQIVYDEKHATQEETPHNVESFIKQRTRWSQGFYEIFAKGDWLKLPSLKQKITSLYILLNSLLQAALVIYLPVGIYIGLTQKLPVVVSLISYLPLFLMILQLFVNLVGIREFTEAYGLRLPLLFRAKMAVWYYPYQLLLAVAAFRAIGRFVTRKNAWEKTAHSNLHRQAQAQAQAQTI